jgi:hypothetical protein
MCSILNFSVVDRQQFDADPGQSFYFGADPDYDPFLKPGQVNNWQALSVLNRLQPFFVGIIKLF